MTRLESVQAALRQLDEDQNTQGGRRLTKEQAAVEILAAADQADREAGIVRARAEAISELADHLEGMADSLDEHVSHEDVHRLLIEALGMSRALLDGPAEQSGG